MTGGKRGGEKKWGRRRGTKCSLGRNLYRSEDGEGEKDGLLTWSNVVSCIYLSWDCPCSSPRSISPQGISVLKEGVGKTGHEEEQEGE